MKVCGVVGTCTDKRLLPSFWVLLLGRMKVGLMGRQAGGIYWTGFSFWGAGRNFPLDRRRAGWAVLCLRPVLVVKMLVAWASSWLQFL